MSHSKKHALTIVLSFVVISAPVLAQFQMPKYVRTINEVRKTVDIDTVAKVLNYSDGMPTDEGSNWGYWYAYDAKNCIYHKATYKGGDGDDKMLMDVTDTRELRLNDIDRSSIKYAFQTISHPSIGQAPRITQFVTVTGDGRVLFETDGLDPERVKKGWALIYSKYCRGRNKEF